MNRPSKMIHIDPKRCKSCGLCIHFCPKSILQFGDDINEWGYNAVILTDPDACTYCGLCQMMCPDIAIRILEAQESLV